MESGPPRRDTPWALSEENVELVRRGLVATSGGDPNGAQAMFDPSIEWDMAGVAGWPEKRLYRGAEVGEFLRAWADSWRDWHFDVIDLQDAGEDRVFAAIREWGIGTESKVSVEQYRYLIFTLRDGRTARVEMFSERADALEAVGLPE
jgi:ketosteroid isomerase-like protein